MTKIKSIYTFYPTKDKELLLCDYEVGLLMLSILNWKDNYGPAHLITNEKGKEYFVEIGIDHLWDNIKVVSVEKGEIDDEIFPDVYKFKILEKEETPFCVIEYDTILKDDVNKMLFDGDIGLPYVEKVGETKHVADNFIYFKDSDLLGKYVKKSITYMKKNSKEKELTPKESFFVNLGINRILLKLVENKKVKVNYLFTTELNPSTQNEFPFTELNKLETTTLFMFTKFNRESIRNKTKVYDSQEGGWVDSYHPKRQHYLNKVRDMVLIEQGIEWYEIFEEIVKDNPLVSNTDFEKGIYFTGQDGRVVI
jgi:hypothetical protein|tara:strand:- start:8208 stop:9134 length:927 start_codon:yes stop_codon:yes gene_type:complete